MAFAFGVDSVLLTEFARDIRKNSTIVDMGSGTGVLSILLSKKVNAKKIISIEKQKEVAEMQKESVKLNSLENTIEVINSDIKDIKLSPEEIDAVVTNPPYKKEGTGRNAKNEKQQISRFESTVDLDNWIKIASSFLNSNGSFYMVYRCDRLQELIQILSKYKLQIKRIRFVYSKASEQSNLVLIKAVKGAKEFVKVEKPLIIYNEDETYTDEIMKIYKK